MRITTWNVNGLRAALRKGMPDHLERLTPDVLLLQEIRVMPEQLKKAWRQPEGWHVAWHPAEKKGYAGTAVWSRHPLEVVGTGIDGEDDPEGRVLSVAVQGVELVSVYLPSGSSGEERQAFKEAWMDRFAAWMADLVARDTPVVVGGDLNVAHTPDDIWNPTGNKKNSGFLPHERAWFTELLGQGWSDLLRETAGEGKGPYSWWSNRGKAREKDRGWRIDYLLANPAAVSHLGAHETTVHREGGMTVSDHAPVTADFTVS